MDTFFKITELFRVVAMLLVHTMVGSVDAVQQVNPEVKVLWGAWISKGEDLAALELGIEYDM